MILEDIVKLNDIQDFIMKKVNDPWINTPFKGIVDMDNISKGILGEKIFKLLMEKYGWTVTNRTYSGNDCVVGDYLVEVKTSIPRKSTLTINHIAEHKKWDRLVVIALDPITKNQHVFWFTKDDFINEIRNDTRVFTRQQGGKQGNNDDWMTNVTKLNNTTFIKDICEW